MKTFGTLEYAIDKYSGSWTWKITGVRAVMMVSKLVPELWYGNGPNEVIIPDNEKNVKKISLILERYPLEILSKSVWQRKLRAKIIKKPTKIKIEKLSKAVAGKQFRGKLLNFQKMGLDFLLKSSYSSYVKGMFLLCGPKGHAVNCASSLFLLISKALSYLLAF